MSDEKKTVLFLTHLYPRYDKDFMAPFLATLIENLTPDYDMIVLSPRHDGDDKIRNGVKLEYFGYCFRSLEKLSYTGNLFAKVRGLNIHYQLLTLCFLVGFLIKGIFLTMKYEPEILHCSWFVPAGLVGYVLSVIFDIPLVITVHSDSFLVKKSRVLRFIAKIIFKQTKFVIAVSNAVKEYVAPVCSNVKVVYSCNRVF